MEVLIKSIGKITTEGISLRLTEPAALNGGLKTREWWVSWDKIGRALFGDAYSNVETVKELDEIRDVPEIFPGTMDALNKLTTKEP